MGLDRLRELDGVVIVLNFTVLALVSAIPFSSDLFGEYSGQPIAVGIYAANIGLATLMLALISWWSEIRGHQVEGIHRGDPLLGFLPSVVFFASIPIAWVSASAAPYVWLAVLLLIPLRGARRTGQRA